MDMRGIPPSESWTCRVCELGTTEAVDPAVGDALQAASPMRAASAAGRRNGCFIKTPSGNGDGAKPPRARLLASPPPDSQIERTYRGRHPHPPIQGDGRLPAWIPSRGYTHYAIRVTFPSTKPVLSIS